jgi:hypothetical protein
MTDEEKSPPPVFPDTEVSDFDEILNVSGHPQQLDRQLGFFSICALSIVADNAWAAGSGTLVVALYDGGAPGVLWEMLVSPQRLQPVLIITGWLLHSFTSSSVLLWQN